MQLERLIRKPAPIHDWSSHRCCTECPISVICKNAYNAYCASTAGGYAAAELKMAGWDGLQVVGKADKPVYIAINNENIEIRDASHVWGMGAEEFEMMLRRGFG